MWWWIACIPPLGPFVAADPAHDFDGDGVHELDGDCDDTDAAIGPSATDLCGDTIDQDCDGSDLACTGVVTEETGSFEEDDDLDDDGYAPPEDCNDADGQIHPQHVEVCADGIDQDCDEVDPVCNLVGEIDPDVEYYEVFQQGWPLWSAGDQDGDGLPEIIVGNISDHSLVLIDYSPTGFGTLTDFAGYYSDGTYSAIGAAALGAFDLTGDGIHDVAVGAPFGFEGTNDGVIWIFPGPVSGPIQPTSVVPTGTVTHYGKPDERYGAVVETTDFDGDGELDLLGVADAASHGAVYVSFGPLPGYTHVADPAVRSAVFTRYDEPAAYEEIGEDLVVGDFDVDGVGDIAFSSLGDVTAASMVWCVYGTDPAFFGEVRTTSVPDTITTRLGGEPYQSPTLAVGDVSGDGADDLIIGLPSDGEGGLVTGDPAEEGVVLVFNGPVLGELTAWEMAETRFVGGEVDARFGASVAVVDSDSDSVGEVVVGSPGEDNTFPDDGAVYLLNAASGATSHVALGDWRARATGSEGEHQLGTAVTAPGDVDGDGHDDFAAGMIGTGGVWLFLGGPDR